MREAPTLMLLISLGLLASGCQSTGPGERPSGGDAPFREGSWSGSVTAGRGWPLRSGDEEPTYVTVGAGVHVLDGLLVGGELAGIRFSQSGPDVSAGSFSALARWHVWSGEAWSLFVDGSVGLFHADRRVPPRGTASNFIEHLGVGGTIRVGGDAHLVLGARFWHLSNAGLGTNPGMDQAIAYAGLIVGF